MKIIRIENTLINIRQFVKAYPTIVRNGEQKLYRVTVQDTSGNSWFDFNTEEEQIAALNHIEAQLKLLGTPWPNPNQPG